MKRRNLFITLTLVTISILQAQETDSIEISLQPIVITATCVPVNSLYLNRTIDIIDEQTIQKMGSMSAEEILQRGANVDVRPRGIFGVQSDVSVRGSLFSQQLVLLNGIRLNDAQTAHHNFDIPISLEQIERIEVLKGPGSALYGPDAYGGIINIITKIPDKKSLRLKFSSGEHGLVNASTSYDFSSGGIHSSNTIEHKFSDGYTYDTDFKITSMATNNTLQLHNGTYSMLAGYTNKEFGAFYFYGPSPSKEWTETTFLNTTAQLHFNSVFIQPEVSYRRHYDKFLYDIHTPDKYVNINTTDSYRGEILTNIQINEISFITLGTEGNIDNIVSSNLENHKRSSLGVFCNFHTILQNKFPFDIGMREDFHSNYGQQFNPTASIGYLFSKDGKLFFTTGSSFRAPSYTELYYSSQKRIGNASLKPETGWSYELGMDYTISNQFRIAGSLFDRDQKNLIDYVKFKFSDTAFSAINFATATTRGIDIELHWININKTDSNPADESVFRDAVINYTYLDSYINIGEISTTLYSFTHPRHQIGLCCSGTLPLIIKWTTGITHKIKLNGTSYTLIDAKLSRSLSIVNIFLQGTNLLNQSYEEIAGTPLPGRWLWSGIEVKVF